jgi:uncharacterized protein YbcV (DUF1398 family)
MKATKRDPDLEKWCEALAGAGVQPDAPPGWLTPVQLAEKLGKNRFTIESSLRELLKQGKAERRKFRTKTAQRTIALWHYRLK